MDLDPDTPAPPARGHPTPSTRTAQAVSELWRADYPCDAAARLLVDALRADTAWLVHGPPPGRLGVAPDMGLRLGTEPEALKAWAAARVPVGGALLFHDAGRPALLLRLGEHDLALVCRDRADDTFGDAERALAESLAPTLKRALDAACAVAEAPLTPRMLAEFLDTLAAPATLRHHGEVVFHNLAARLRARRGDTPDPAVPPARIFTFGASGVEVHVDAATLGEPAPTPPPDPFADLPPWLKQVADMLADGKSDKEIAEAIGKNLATTRTAVQRVFKRLGVHSRTEMVKRGWRGG
jgi:hypothetical protein